MAAVSGNDQRAAMQQLGHGTQLHRDGQLGLAQSHYQRAVKLDPANADGWHLLGVVALQSGNGKLAVKHLHECVRLRPAFAEAQNNLGVALRRLDRHVESVDAFRAATQVRDRYVEAAGNLGLALLSIGDDEAAESVLQQCLDWKPDHADAATNLGNLLRRNGRLMDALPLLECVVAQPSAQPQDHANLALLLIDLGRHAAAIDAIHKALALAPEQARWWCIRGIAQRLQHDLEAGVESLRKACTLDPTDQTAAFELALAVLESGATDEARTLLARVKPPTGTVEKLRWMRALALPVIYRDDDDVDLSRERFEAGLRELDDGLRLDTATRLDEALQAVSGVATFHLHYQPRNNTSLQHAFGDLVGRVMQKVAPQWSEPCEWKPGAHGGPIRVGVVSSHLMQHSVSRYFGALLAGLDPQRFDVRVWYSGGVRDESTDAIAASVAQFHDVHDDVLTTAAAIRASQIDVLVYPEIGLDPRHQALAALRLAPTQCVLAGHPVGTGLATMDYFVSGVAIEPANADVHYRERLVRLPGFGASPPMLPPLGDASWLDAVGGSGKLLLCAQYHPKLVPGFDDVLARIVEATGSRIGFFNRQPALGRRFRQRIDAVFVRRGLDPARHLVDLRPQRYTDYLAGVAASPLILDSSWFSGGATSLDALGVGTPVIAHEGSMARGRQTAGMLRLLGIDELVAKDDDDYVAKAVACIRESELRNALADRIGGASSMLFGAPEPIAAFAEFLADPTGWAAQKRVEQSRGQVRS